MILDSFEKQDKDFTNDRYLNTVLSLFFGNSYLFGKFNNRLDMTIKNSERILKICEEKKIYLFLARILTSFAVKVEVYDKYISYVNNNFERFLMQDMLLEDLEQNNLSEKDIN